MILNDSVASMIVLLSLLSLLSSSLPLFLMIEEIKIFLNDILNTNEPDYIREFNTLYSVFSSLKYYPGRK